MEIRIYFEGDKALKPGFHAFFSELCERARAVRCRMELIATDGTPHRDFDIAIRKHPEAWNILLLDSDGPANEQRAVDLVATRGWAAVQAGSIFWMIEMMESWFHADKDAIGKHYGDGFKREALKQNPNVEQISKKDLENGLKAATRNTKKGAYHKTKHAPALLERIDPDRVRQAAPQCDRLFRAVLASLE